jgi:RimJ/RimL family protein N-acetyltransferase
MVILKKFYSHNITKKYLGWLQDRELIKYTNINPKINFSQVKKYIKDHQHNNKQKIFRIFFNRKHVGNIRIFFLNKNQATIAILVGEKKLHSLGIGTKSIRLGFKILKKIGINEVLAYVHIKNKASKTLFKKIGFIKILKKDTYFIFKYFLEK